ncbi:hypothetical protein [Domibacillus mangrovi]|uniref:Uncharacterized protein n=1 Tax=Domibacillus mangrovi TaxID=1714354 RepID=A0A1Q5NZP0_9BACI|nr:hypothetical protein [Domibacillus mangrovi]OKL35378.1 hypothetical protein BLL40_15820 [Domibacillus mangrovi]
MEKGFIEIKLLGHTVFLTADEVQQLLKKDKAIWSEAIKRGKYILRSRKQRESGKQKNKKMNRGEEMRRKLFYYQEGNQIPVILHTASGSAGTARLQRGFIKTLQVSTMLKIAYSMHIKNQNRNKRGGAAKTNVAASFLIF